MQSLEINQENFASVQWDDDYFKYCQFVDISTDGGHVTSDFANCTFRNIDWYWGHFNIVNFVDCVFENCIFRRASFSDCKFVECVLRDCKFLKDNLGGDCNFHGTVAYSCEVTNCESFAPIFR
jgi:uncharacterized protein YjbI with pentapeptide repeats